MSKSPTNPNEFWEKYGKKPDVAPKQSTSSTKITLPKVQSKYEAMYSPESAAKLTNTKLESTVAPSNTSMADFRKLDQGIAIPKLRQSQTSTPSPNDIMESLVNFGGPVNTKNASTLEVMKASWAVGKGQKLVNDGYKEKMISTDPNAGEDKIAEGRKLIEANIDIVNNEEHKFGKGNYITETARAMVSPDYWESNQVQQLPTNLPLMAESTVAGLIGNIGRTAPYLGTAGGIAGGVAGGVGGSILPGPGTVAGAVGGAAGGTAAGLAVAGGATALQAGMIADVTKKEAEMEAAGVFQTILEEEIAKGTSYDIAREIALEAADKNYKANIGIIAGTNIGESLLIFGKPLKFLTKGTETIAKEIVKGGTKKAIMDTAKAGAKEIGKIVGTGTQEGGQELAQFAAEKWATDKPIDLSSEEAKASVAGGFGMGSMTATAGTVGSGLANKILGKSTTPGATPTTEGNTSSVSQVSRAEEPNIRTTIQEGVADSTQQGVTDKSQIGTIDLVMEHIQNSMTQGESWEQLVKDRNGNPGMTEEEHGFLYDEIMNGPSQEPIDTSQLQNIDAPTRQEEQPTETIPEPNQVIDDTPMEGDHSLKQVVEFNLNQGNLLPDNSYSISTKNTDDDPSVAVAREFAKLSGNELIMVTPNNEEADLFNGYISPDHNKILINDKSDNPVHTVMYHEVVHDMKYSAPDVFEEYRQATIEFAGDGIQKWVADRFKLDWNSLNEDSKDHYVEEFMADSMQDVGSRKEFFSNLLARSYDAAKSFLQSLSKMIARLEGITIDPDYAMSRYVNDLKSWEESCTKAMSDYINVKTGTVAPVTPVIEETVNVKESKNTKNKTTGKKEVKVPEVKDKKTEVKKTENKKEVKVPEARVNKPKNNKTKTKNSGIELSNDELLVTLDKAMADGDMSTVEAVTKEIKKREGTEENNNKKSGSKNKPADDKEKEPNTKKASGKSTKNELNARNKKSIEDDENTVEVKEAINYKDSNVELTIRTRNGDKEARNQLIENNMGIVKTIANKNKNRGVDVDDLIQEGYIELIKVIDEVYDPTRPTSLASIAYKSISGKINRYIYKSWGLPERRVMLFNKYLQVKSEVYKTTGETPSLKEIASIIGEYNGTKITAKMLEELVNDAQMKASLDMIIGEEGEISKMDVMSSEDIFDLNAGNVKKPDDIIFYDFASHEIMKTIDELLSDQQKKVIMYRYGFTSASDKDIMDAPEVAAILGISKQRVYQLEKKALEILRNNDLIKDIHGNFSTKLRMVNPSLFSIKYKADNFYSKARDVIESNKFPEKISIIPAHPEKVVEVKGRMQYDKNLGFAVPTPNIIKVIPAKPEVSLADNLKNILSANDVKDEEIKWMGIDLLNQVSTPFLTKNALLDHIDTMLNRLKVDVIEYQKGWDDTPEDVEIVEYISSVDGESHYRVSHSDEVVDYVDGDFFIHTNDGRILGPYYNLREAERGYEEEYGREVEYFDYTTGDQRYYVEMILTLPELEYNGHGHWNDKNVVMHIRFGVLKDSNGRDILFVNEIQSDIHQGGKKHGYMNDKNSKMFEMVKNLEKMRKGIKYDENLSHIAGKIRRTNEEIREYRNRLDPEVYIITKEYERSIKDVIRVKEAMLESLFTELELLAKDPEVLKTIGQIRQYNKYRYDKELAGKMSPEYPYKNTNDWVLRAIKQIIDYAVKFGYDKVIFANGNDNYSLYTVNDDNIKGMTIRRVDKHALDIDSFDGDPFVYHVRINRADARTTVYSIDEIKDIFGHDIYNEAKKLVDGESVIVDINKPNPSMESGMTKFYDDLVINVVNKYTKQWGIKCKPIEVVINEESTTRMGFETNGKMIDTVLGKGQPMFSAKVTKRGFIKSMNESGIYTDDDAKAMIHDILSSDQANYSKITLDELTEFAKEQVSKGINHAYNTMNKPDLKPGQRTALGIHLHMALNQKALESKANGDIGGAIRAISVANRVLLDTSAYLTAAGQEVASAAIVQRVTASDVMSRIVAQTNMAYNKLNKNLRKEVEEKSSDLFNAMVEVNAESIDETLSNLSDVINDLKYEVDNKSKSNKRVTNDMIITKLTGYFGNKLDPDDPILRVMGILDDIVNGRFSAKKDAEPGIKPLDVALRFLNGDPQIMEHWDEIRSVLMNEYREVFDSPQEFYTHYMSRPSSESALSKRILDTMKIFGIDMARLVTDQDIKLAVDKIMTINRSGYRPLVTAKLKSMVNGYKSRNSQILAERLIKLANNSMGEKEEPNTFDVVKDKEGIRKNDTRNIMNTIVKLAREKLPRSIPEPKDPMDMIAQVMIYYKEYQRLWMDSEKTIMEEFGDKNSEEIEVLQEFFNRPIDDLFTRGQIESLLRNALKPESLTINNIVRKHYTEQSAIIESLADKLINGANMKKEDAAKLAKIIEDKFENISYSRKKSILNNLLKDVKKRNRKTFMDRVIMYSNLGALNEDQYRQLVCEQLGIPTLTPEVALAISDLCDRVQTAEYKAILSDDKNYEIRWTNTYKYQLLNKQGEEIGRYNTLEEAQQHTSDTEWSGYPRVYGTRYKEEILAEINYIVGSVINPTWMRKLSSVQTIGMILNMVTIEKNIIGNELNWWAYKASLMAAVPIDWTRSKLTGEDRKITFSPVSLAEDYANWYDGLIFGIKLAGKGHTPNAVQGQYELGYTPAFDKDKSWIMQPFKFGERMMRVALLGPDQASYIRAYSHFIGMQAKLMCINNGVPVNKRNIDMYTQEIDTNITGQANEFAKFMTFQDDNKLTDTTARIKRGLNLGLDFGAGDVVMKFTKVASNLTIIGMQYSPFGLLYGVYEINKAKVTANKEDTKPDYTQAENVIARAITGSVALTGFGLWMAMIGIMTGAADADDDEKVKAFNKSLGNTYLKFNYSAFNRYILSGFDKKKARWKDGDIIFDYTWLQPVAVPMATGVAIGEEIKKESSDTPKAVFNVAVAGLRTIMAMPVFTGLADVLRSEPGESINPIQLGYNIATALITDGPSSFVPATVRQNRLQQDPYLRKTYSKNPLEESKNRLYNRLPGKSGELTPQTDLLGKPLRRTPGMDNGIMGYLNSYILPTPISKLDTGTGIKKIIYDLYQESGTSDALPGSTNRQLQKNKVEINMTDKQYTELLNIRGGYIEDNIKLRKETLTNMNLPVATRLKVMNDIYKDATDRARKDMKKKLF